MSALGRFVRVWNNDPSDPRSRFRLEQFEDDDLCVLAEEEVVAGDPADPDAPNIESHDVMWLLPADVRRLRDALTELLAVMPEDP
jgi:hypothetical protein